MEVFRRDTTTDKDQRYEGILGCIQNGLLGSSKKGTKPDIYIEWVASGRLLAGSLLIT